jgi:hypothetical protein
MDNQTNVFMAWEEASEETRRIEPDWTESEWFQVWLDLARLPHESPDLKLTSQTATLPISQS